MPGPVLKSCGGLVLVAAPGRPLGDVIKAQLRANPFNAPLLPAAPRCIRTPLRPRPASVAHECGPGKVVLPHDREARGY